MNNLNVKSAIISTLIVYVLGVSAFLVSFFIPLMANLELQANLALMLTIIPASLFGASIYYRKGHHTNGFVLGAFMFVITMLLDAVITVPLFVIPNGGSHFTFFTDPGFWLIALEYIVNVGSFWYFKISKKASANHSQLKKA